MAFNNTMGMPAIINQKTYNRILAHCIAEVGGGDLWVFGYGSLMRRPGFRPQETAAARLYGYSRRLAVRSTHYRGTAKQPGLVFGLDAGGCCNGVLLRAPTADKKRVIQTLFRREMFADVYEPRYVRVCKLPTTKNKGGNLRALTFVSRRDNAHYVPNMPLPQAAAIIRLARGFGGSNADYIIESHRELQRRGVACPQLALLCRLLQS